MADALGPDSPGFPGVFRGSFSGRGSARSPSLERASTHAASQLPAGACVGGGGHPWGWPLVPTGPLPAGTLSASEPLCPAPSAGARGGCELGSAGPSPCSHPKTKPSERQSGGARSGTTATGAAGRVPWASPSQQADGLQLTVPPRPSWAGGLMPSGAARAWAGVGSGCGHLMVGRPSTPHQAAVGAALQAAPPGQARPGPATVDTGGSAWRGPPGTTLGVPRLVGRVSALSGAGSGRHLSPGKVGSLAGQGGPQAQEWRPVGVPEEGGVHHGRRSWGQ